MKKDLYWHQPFVLRFAIESQSDILHVTDPAKVARVALENAASIAGMLLTTECVLCDIKEPEPPMPAGNPGMGGMGGMY